MMLQRVIREMLRSFGEHHAVDLALGPGADEFDLLVDLGQSTAEGSHGPLQRRIAVDGSTLVGEVPDLVPPILQVDESQVSARADKHFRRTAMKTGVIDRAASHLIQERRFGAFFQNDQRMAQVNAAVGDHGLGSAAAGR